MEIVLGIVFIVGIALGGIGGFFVGSGRTIEMNSTQYTEVVTTTVQNQAQVTIIGDSAPRNATFVVTNLPSKRALDEFLVTLDSFQLANCEILAEQVWFGSRFTVIYPVYTAGAVTNTSRVVLTNVLSTNQMRVR